MNKKGDESEDSLLIMSMILVITMKFLQHVLKR